MIITKKTALKFVSLVALLLSVDIHAGFIEKDNSIYFKESSGIVNDVRISYTDYSAVISYRLVDTSKDDKWAIITWEKGGVGMPTSELNFIYYYPKKIALDSSLHNAYLYEILIDKKGEYLGTKEDETIYLTELEMEINKSKYIKNYGNGCSGPYSNYTECGLYLNTTTNHNELYLKIDDIDYSLYDKALDNIKVGKIRVTPPVIYYKYLKGDVYYKNFWHYSTGTKYNINVNRNKKNVTSSHKDFELKKGVARHAVKEFTRSQDIFESPSKLIGSYNLNDNNKGLYKLYIYKQDLKLRFFLFEPSGDLEVMGDVLADAGKLNFINKNSSNKYIEKIIIKSDESLKSIDIKFNKIDNTYDLVRNSTSNPEY